MSAHGPELDDRWIFHDGEFMRISRCPLNCNTQALQYGTGVFEGIRSYALGGGVSYLFRAQDHFARLLRSARMLHVDIKESARDLVDVSVELLKRNAQQGNAYIRPLAYKLALEPGTPFGVRLRGVSSTLTITSLAMGSYVAKDGIRCAVSSWRRIPGSCLPVGAKITGAYVGSALATDEASCGGYDDAIFLNHAGNVAEAPTANVFVVHDDTISTPGLDSDILAGITRNSVVALLERHLGIRTQQRTITRSELYAADEVFLTGTGCEIVPVVEVDGRPIGAGAKGKLTMAVAEMYERAVMGEDPGCRDWLTSIEF